MKTYSFNAHEIGTEVWVNLSADGDGILKPRKLTIYDITIDEKEFRYSIGRFSAPFNKVFLTKEEAEGSL